METRKLYISLCVFMLWCIGMKATGSVHEVTWLDLKIKSEKFNAVLSWSTSEEINNEIYVIERSDNGLTFYTIGTLPGAGNSKSISNYSFIDINSSTGVTYYRLKQIDRDKNFSYSEAIAFNTNSTTQLNISPYPNNGEFDINIISPDSNLQIIITSLQSKEIYQTSIINNTSLSNSIHVRLNTNPGLYMVYLNTGTEYRIANLKIE